MELEVFFKSVIDQDAAAVVICDLDCKIVYMNPASVRRYKRSLAGCSLLDCHNAESVAKILKVLAWFKENSENNSIYTFRNDKENKDVYMVALRDEEKNLIGFYEKHEYRNREIAEPYGTI